MRKALLSLVLLGFGATLFAQGITDAKGYNKASTIQWQWAKDALQKYPWIGSERVLDLGSGDGKITAEIADIYTKGLVLGIDISPNMIAYSSDAFKKQNLLYQQLDIAKIEFVEQFDLATAFCSLHYVVEQEEALKRIHQSLKEDGHLLFVGPGLDGTSVGNISANLATSDKWLPFFPEYQKQRVYYTKDQYITLLEKTGFSPIFFNVSYDSLQFSDKTALTSWLKGFVNYISHLSDEQKENFLSDIANEMLKYNVATEDGKIQLQSSLFECLVKKVLS